VQCIRKIIGAKAHSSSAAVEVVSGIYPLVVRKSELCSREYIRILAESKNHPLKKLLGCTKRKGLYFCPLEYIKTMGREMIKSVRLKYKKTSRQKILLDH